MRTPHPPPAGRSQSLTRHYLMYHGMCNSMVKMMIYDYHHIAWGPLSHTHTCTQLACPTPGPEQGTVARRRQTADRKSKRREREKEKGTESASDRETSPCLPERTCTGHVPSAYPQPSDHHTTSSRVQRARTDRSSMPAYAFCWSLARAACSQPNMSSMSSLAAWTRRRRS